MSASFPDVSVVVPTRNRGPLIERTLASLLRQRLGAVQIEVIVVDNGSTDATADVVRRAAAANPERVRYVFEARPGSSYARNTGISLAHAPIVAFCDDDQEVAPDWTSVLHRGLTAHTDIDAIGGLTVPVWSSPPPAWLTGRELCGPVSAINAGPQAFRIGLSRWLCLAGGNLAVRRQALEALGGFDPAYPRTQDRELLVRFLLSGREALYEPAMIVYHHIDGSRVTRGAYRRWYRTEGRMRAGYAFDELFLTGARMRPLPSDAVRLLGVAPAIYRRLLREGAGAIAAALSGQRDRAFLHQLRLLYTWSYIRRRQQLALGGIGVRAVAHDLAAFVRAKLA